MGRFDGKVAFITGAARGQGRSHTLTMAREGADIIAIDLCAPIDSVTYPMAEQADLESVAKEVEALDRRMSWRIADVRDFDAVQSAVDAGVAELGRLDIVCANAGIGGFGKAEELTAEAWGDMIGINLTGVWHTAKASIPHLADRGGSMILTSSTAGVRGIPNIAHYSAAKHGVIGLGKTLALELADRNIRVNMVVPTSVDTPLIHNQAAYDLFAPDIDIPTRADVASRFAALNALPVPWINPSDVSALVAFLASEDARYITGAVMPVDAGQTAT
ncbi:mycofactocin-coupled SDR family oxidoreductase [Gordonia sp. HNM0687]|uniref:Mycofactocin-coupled SDR family oxidoreductase n=1 Tax=Gordonia mangrovi TaxID=2665643 RepID=A0A6L7GXD8_9ACTN|nr:mycofactocin-coupled SDR family oxidoreductase [Gordonia mangrovi]MXP24207.1 mycofactocin-coupled SDR family oxidoreductase [Gordonia mangrovi]UVF76901.1 mycofactocin-coupled SDR family oxidoreductase [Gordonia mangrovi]